MPLEPGQIIGAYEVVEGVASGGMASVYRVRHQALGSNHALKVLHDHLTKSKAIRARFLEEGRIQARCLHRHIVRVTDILDEGNVVCLIMDWIDGPALDAYLLQKKRLPIDLAVDWTLQLLDALDTVRLHHRQVLYHGNRADVA